MQMHSQTRDAECCLGPALSAAGKVMGHVGGKMAVLCASLPSTGEARLKHRENPRALGTDREHLLLKAEDPWYQVRREKHTLNPFRRVPTLGNALRWCGFCVPAAGTADVFPSFNRFAEAVLREKTHAHTHTHTRARTHRQREEVQYECKVVVFEV